MQLNETTWGDIGRHLNLIISMAVQLHIVQDITLKEPLWSKLDIIIH